MRRAQRREARTFLRLRTQVGICSVSGIPGARTWALPRWVAVVPQVLAEFSLLACLVASGWSVVLLLAGIVPVAFSPVPALLACALPCVLVTGAHAVATRTRTTSWIVRHLTGVTVLACVMGITALCLWERTLLATQLPVLVDTITHASVGEAPSDAHDVAALACVISALVSTLACLFSLVLGAGWLVGLVSLPLLGAYPELGLTPTVSLVVLTTLPLAGLVSHDGAQRRHGRVSVTLPIVLACAALCLAIAVPVAERAFDRLAAAPQAVNDWATDLYDDIRTNGLPLGRARSAASDAPTDTADAATPGTAGAEQPETSDAADGSTAPAPIDIPSAGGGTINRGDLQLTGEQLFSVTLDTQPSATLYLRQFVGASYADGLWTAAGESSFVHAEAAALGADVPSVEQTLAQLPHEQALSLAGAGAPGIEPLRVALQALSPAFDASSLAPYASVVDGSDPQAYDALSYGTYADLSAIGTLALAAPSPADSLGAAVLADYGAWVPTAYAGVDAGALPRLAQLVADNPQPDVASITDFVLRTLSDNATYTLTPGAYPTDVDVAEYLLFDGHQGYCQHFATAAALMYRLYGVPARYVSGYAVPPSAFSQAQDGTWQAAASDVRAHAWVELYTPQLGWVPLDVTPTGSAEAAPYAQEPSDEVGYTGAVPPVEPATGDGDEQDGGDVDSETQSTSEMPEAGTLGQEGAADSVGGEGDSMASGISAPPDTPGAPGAAASGDGGPTGTGAATSQPDVQDTASQEGNAPQASSDQDSPDSAGESHRSPGAVLAISLGIIGLAAGAVLITRAMRSRRRRILAARNQAPADALLVDLLAALRYAGLVEPLAGTEPDSAKRLAAAVPGLRLADAEHLAHEALRASYGPTPAQPADDRCRDAYACAVDYAYGTLPRRRQLTFTYVHCWR